MRHPATTVGGAGRGRDRADHRGVLLRHLPLAPVLGLLALAAAVQTALAHREAPTQEMSATAGGFVVEDVRFTLDPGDPTVARTVTFALRGGRPAVVEAHAASRRVRCGLAGAHAVCEFRPAVPVRDLTRLRVVAT